MKKLRKLLKKWKLKLKDWKSKAKRRVKKLLSWRPSFKMSHLIWKSWHMLKSLVIMPVLLISLIMLVSKSTDQWHSYFLQENVGDSVVFIMSPKGAKLQGSGTGFHIQAPSGKTYIMTNHHICELQKDGYVMVQDKLHSNRLIPRRVIEMYEYNDLCIVEPLASYKGLEVAETAPGIGKFVYGVGYPLGEELNISQGRIKSYRPISLMVGPVSEELPCNGYKQYKKTVQFWFFEFEACLQEFDSANTDTPIYPGNSGSPMVDMWGKVQGVFFAANQRTAWGSAVPLDDLKQFLKAY